MSVRRVDGQPLPPAVSNPPKAQPAAPAAPQAKPARARDGLSQAVDLGRAAALGNTAVRHVPLPSIAPGEVHPQGTGPLELTSRAAQEAVKKSVDHFAKQGVGAPGVNPKELRPKSVEVDQLGMTHVRLDRTEDGLRVWGEQVVTHLDQKGEVADVSGSTAKLAIPASAKGQPAVSAEQALGTAKKAFAAETGMTAKNPGTELLFYKGQDGQYHKAYRVEVENLTDSKTPLRMNYMIDAHSGQQLSQFNTLHSVELRGPSLASAQGAPVTVTGSATPKAPIKDLQTVTSKIQIDQDVDVSKLTANLDIAHSYKGDLVVELTSPSGKKATISNKQGGSGDNIKGAFDLSAFKGESSKGTWTLTVKDTAKNDQGTLNGWGLNISGTTKIPGGGSGGGTGGAPGTGASMYSGSVPLTTKKNADGTWSLVDDSRGGSKTLDAQNKSTASGNVGFKDKNNVWGEAGDDPRAKAAIDAHYGMAMTWDFMKNVLGRNSIDDKGEPLNSYVHLDKNYNNAYWDGKQMQYGDGDGKDFGPLVTIDIAGHEIAHGLTERTAGLVYEGESGGLNEAFSDIIGKGVEWYASQQNPAIKFDWTLGKAAFTPGKPNDGLRYMDDPTKDGYSIDNYKEYPKQTEVHGSSGIANHAFVLAVQGGTNKTSGQKVENGIGMEKALKAFYRAEAYYMTPNTTFAEAKAATIKAATDLYGAASQEVKTITAAWTAVGVK
ncbi:MAG TPA: M4 family metallopeptidase [Myxococcaceae bacterium]|nr:M4 family metallopeptidase [Myxococcaceae bacterium]